MTYNPPPGPYPPQGPYNYFPPARTNSMSIASLVLGVVGILGGWCIFGIPSLLAIIFGHIALKQIKERGEQGRGLAIAGLVMGYVVLIPAIIFSILLLVGSVHATWIPYNPSPSPSFIFPSVPTPLSS